MRRASLVVAAIMCMVVGAVAAQEPITIKFSHTAATDTPKGRAAERFKRLAEERTSGKVNVEVFPNSRLFKEDEELDAVRLGTVQMLAPSLSSLSSMGAHAFGVFDLPFLVSNREALRRITDGPIGVELLKSLDSIGLIGLAFWDNGFKIMSANQPLHNLKDFKGLKMRIHSSAVLDAQMRALGAIPAPMRFSAVHAAVSSGVVDGTEVTPADMSAYRLDHVQKHATLSDHGYAGSAIIVNKKFWDALPDDIRAALEGAMQDATEYANAIAQKDNEDALARMKTVHKTSFHRLSDAEKNAWRNALLPVYRAMRDPIGADLIQAVCHEAKTAGCDD